MKTIYLSGIAVIITPFLGIPYFWKTLLLVILGLLIFAKGYFYYKRDKKEIKKLESSFKQNDQTVIKDIPIYDEKEEDSQEQRNGK